MFKPKNNEILRSSICFRALMKLPNMVKETRARVITRDKRTCQYCGKGGLYKAQLNIDHIHPESEGGLFTESNLLVACKQCNHRKGKKAMGDYILHRLAQIERERNTLLALQNKI